MLVLNLIDQMLINSSKSNSDCNTNHILMYHFNSNSSTRTFMATYNCSYGEVFHNIKTTDKS